MANAGISRLRWPAFLIVFVLLAITVGSSLITHHTNRQQERRLLNERAAEVALILTDSFTSLQTQLSTMAAETSLNGANRHSFLTAANALAPATAGFQTGLARLDRTSGEIRFLVTTGDLSMTPTPAVSDLLRRTLTGSVRGATSAVLPGPTHPALALAQTVGRNDLAIYERLPLDISAATKALTSGRQFHELRVALYAGPEQDPDQLLLTTNGGAPHGSSVVTASSAFGADTWLVAVEATSPLTGTFAHDGYLIVLGVGLVITALVGLVVVTVQRRRDYAMSLVADRTEALEHSMRELEHTQEQLVRNERLAAIGELASVVGHELRNPLGVITNAHYLLRGVLERNGADPDASRHLGTAEREVGAATLIVGDLLDYARAREPVTAPVDVADLLTEIESVLAPPPEVTVVREDAPGLPPVLADRDQLRQVLLNLMSNAYEAVVAAVHQAVPAAQAGGTGPNGATVTVRTTSTEDDKVRIAVADTGIGMDDETRGQVFEPFFSRKTRGTGLGLAVTRRIVDSHGGSIRIETQEGVGSTFTVEFPAAGGAEGGVVR
ncbi:MAG TPA: ATP-binding protein [Mycobacteriales bacterium]|nr:ATP-binding protein [Mycobacteriales bacterium]